jgi:hypothetical protein
MSETFSDIAHDAKTTLDDRYIVIDEPIYEHLDDVVVLDETYRYFTFLSYLFSDIKNNVILNAVTLFQKMDLDLHLWNTLRKSTKKVKLNGLTLLKHVKYLQKSGYERDNDIHGMRKFLKRNNNRINSMKSLSINMTKSMTKILEEIEQKGRNVTGIHEIIDEVKRINTQVIYLIENLVKYRKSLNSYDFMTSLLNKYKSHKDYIIKNSTAAKMYKLHGMVTEDEKYNEHSTDADASYTEEDYVIYMFEDIMNIASGYVHTTNQISKQIDEAQ